MTGWGISPKYASGIAQTSIVVVVTYLSIVVGELVPKRIGMSGAERIAKIMAAPMWLMSKVALPAGVAFIKVHTVPHPAAQN